TKSADNGEFPADAEEGAVRAVEEFGNKVIRDETAPGQPVISISLTGSKPTAKRKHSRKAQDSDLKGLAAFTHLRALDLSGTNVTDAGMRDVAALTSLRELNLTNTGVTDAGLRELAPLKQLRSLRLYSTKITNAGLKDLIELRGLQELSLEGGVFADS